MGKSSNARASGEGKSALQAVAVWLARLLQVRRLPASPYCFPRPPAQTLNAVPNLEPRREQRQFGTLSCWLASLGGM